MATVKITDLTAYTDPKSTDVLPIVDVTNDITKKVDIAAILKNAPLGSAAAPSLAIDGDPNTGIYSPGADQLAVSTGGTQRLTVDASGNLGIGTASPAVPLHVIGNEIRVQSSTANNGFIRFLNTSGSMSIGMTGANENTLLLYDRTNSQTAYSYIGGASGCHLWCVNNTERLRIDSSGNLGLGVVPSAWTALKAVSVGSTGSSIAGNANGLYLTQSAYYSGGWRYSQSSVPATLYQQVDNVHSWYTAPSGTAGNAISFTQVMTLDADGNLILSGTGYIDIPVGTTAQRPGSPSAGMIRYNSTLNQFEGYGTAWGAIGGGATGGTGNAAFYENDINITASYTITSGKNAMSAGPVVVANSVVVTVPAGSTWTVV